MRISMILRCANSDIARLLGEQRLPVEAALDHMQIALGETLRARARADRIGRFIDEQRFIAGDADRFGPECRARLRREVVAGNFHCDDARGDQQAADGGLCGRGDDGQKHSRAAWTDRYG